MATVTNLVSDADGNPISKPDALLAPFPPEKRTITVLINEVETPYTVNYFETDEPFLAIGIAIDGLDEYAQQCFFTDSSDGWFFGDGSFDPYVDGEVDMNGYSGTNIVPFSGGGLRVNTGVFTVVARGGNPGHAGGVVFFLEPGAGNASSFVVSGNSAIVEAAYDQDTNTDKLGFFNASPVAQAAHIDPTAITTAQIGQILLDFGLMAQP